MKFSVATAVELRLECTVLLRPASLLAKLARILAEAEAADLERASAHVEDAIRQVVEPYAADVFRARRNPPEP